MADKLAVVPSVAVDRTIEAFSALDASGDRRSMNKLARRLGKEQPALLAFAARARTDHGETTGEAAVFYATLMWAMFERHAGKQLSRLTAANLEEAKAIVDAALAVVEGLHARPIHERVSPALVERQPHLYAKLQELFAEDVTEDAMTDATATAIFPMTQTVIEAFDAAIEGRRPGERIGPVVREQPKVGRNDPCSCGSGKKFKRCCGAA